VRFPAVYRLWIEDADDYKIHEPMLAKLDRKLLALLQEFA